MEDISLHILDIAENSIRAGAKEIVISVIRETAKDLLTIIVKDNGAGMNDAQTRMAPDPFYTGKSGRKIGLGLPLLEDAARMADGSLSIESKRNIGTTVTAVFNWSHIDRKPIGKISETIVALISSYPDVDFTLNIKRNEKGFNFATKDVKTKIRDVAINSTSVLSFIEKYIEENIESFFKN
ncbi:MAG: sensor histidine kinase [Ignavibacteriales bacterium]|nr:sensor histidine kinase [Ignavibacteriales bacterium]